MKAGEAKPARSIARRTLLNVAARISLVVALASIVSYWHVRSGLERQALEYLERYVEQRRVRESAIFELASGNLGIFAKAYLEELRWTDVREAETRFDSLFEARPDGTHRLREEAFRSHGVTGVVGRHVPLDRDLKRRLMAAFDLVARFGPAWGAHFASLYVVTPENALLIYWPGQPWALTASDWEVAGKLALLGGQAGEVVVAGPAAAPVSDRERWSELYFDYGVNDWLVSVTRPVAQDGRHLLSIGHDVLLRDLVDRTVASSLPGTYNVIFSEDGRLVAHPRFMEAIQAKSGALAIADTGDADLARIHKLAVERKPAETILRDEAAREFLAVTPLAGPGWIMATVFPQAITANAAWETARLILLLGALALVAELLILGSVLRREISQPLRKLVAATGSLASGRFRNDLDIRRDDEIGELATAFTAMAGEVDARETALSERSASLARANERLAHELEERRRAERELARHRELSALLNTIDYGVLFLDADLKVRLTNRAYRAIWGIPETFYDEPRTLADDLRRRREAGLFEGDDEALAADLAERLSAVRRGREGVRERRLPNGAVVQTQIVTLPDGGRMLSYVDVTASKRSEDALRDATRRAEEANRAKSAFLANMSHELRTPMNAIIGFTRIVLRRSADSLPERQAANLEKILGSANHLLTLINDVLDLSKIESGRMEVYPNLFSLSPLVEGCLKTIEPMMATGRVRAESEIEPDLPPLYTDEDKLRQILLNLLSNAAKFTESGSIRVVARRRGGAVEIAVTDTGIGIPQEAQDLVFEEFRQADGSTTRPGGGTGLGLTISRRLARLMGGDISLESRLGNGSTFRVVVPIRLDLAAERRAS